MHNDDKPLTDAGIRALTAKNVGQHWNTGEKGLYLDVSKSGTKSWRFKYTLNGQQGRFTLGRYPAIGLAKARQLAHDARTLVQSGKAPIEEKRAQKAAHEAEKARTFQTVAEQWLKRERGRLVERSIQGFQGALANHIYPAIGGMQVSEIRLEHIAGILRNLEAKGTTSMAKRVRTIVRAVLGYAQGLGWVELNVADSRGGALRIDHRVQNFAAIETPNELGRFLHVLGTGQDDVISRALRLLFLLAPRPGELATMRWEDLTDLESDTPEWRYVPGKTARKEQGKHIVPLPPQAVEILRLQHKSRVVDQAGRGWVFPSPRYPGRPITADALLKAIRRIGFSSTAHGARACFRSLAQEKLGADWIVLELMLSHNMPGPLGATYARAQLLPQRREVAQKWADYLDQLRIAAGAQ